MVYRNLYYIILLNFNLIYLFYINQYKIYQNKYVELSASNIKYIAYLPIVTKAWNRIGFYVNIFIIYYNLTFDIIIVNEKLKHLKCTVVLLRFNRSQSLHYLSKISRIFGFMISETKSDNFYYLSDADIFPVSKTYFNKMNQNKLTIKSFDKNGYGYGRNKGKWAMCYMVANRAIWKDILFDDIIPNNPKETILTITINELNRGEKYFAKFSYIDEVYLRDKIKSWRHFNRNVVFNVRKYRNTRIDRNKLSNTSLLNITNIIDIHLPSLTKDIFKKWKSKIIPLQKYFFHSTPYDISYLRSILGYNRIIT